MTAIPRWQQRYQNFCKALQTLINAKELGEQRPFSELEKQGLIQGFEFTHELGWNTLKDYLEYQGISDLIGSRDATRSAFRQGLLQDGEAWMDMIRSRNLSSHTYRAEIAEQIAQSILGQYIQAFIALRTTLAERLSHAEADG